jgi:hypothetical protein
VIYAAHHHDVYSIVDQKYVLKLQVARHVSCTIDPIAGAELPNCRIQNTRPEDM